jgi:hypothetical protein
MVASTALIGGFLIGEGYDIIAPVSHRPRLN